jgi:hypothetical protein
VKCSDDFISLVVDLPLGIPCCPSCDQNPSDLHNASEQQLKANEVRKMKEIGTCLQERE